MSSPEVSNSSYMGPGGQIIAGIFVMALVFTVTFGCSDGDVVDGSNSPLQPLIYTEDPELTPEGASVREARLKRQLLEGSADGPWGRLGQLDAVDLPGLHEPEALGVAITDAMLERDERLWEHVFLSDQTYARLVGVDDREAAEFVDNTIGDSLQAWKRFERTRASQLPEGGLDGQLQFEEIELGAAHEIDGRRLAERQLDDVRRDVQFWDNRVVLNHVDTDVRLQLRIPRIFRIYERDDNEDGDSVRYQVGSEIELDSKFQTFLDVGLHLQPQLLRAEEYSFPLGIGTFWRYQRFPADQAPDDDPLEIGLDQRRDVNAGELIIEVREVSKYGPIHLVELLHSYNDHHHTRVREWWVATPRRIYLCNSRCRDDIGDVERLLDYFDRRRPLMKFPVEPGDRWESASTTGSASPPVVDEQWHRVETPAGSFSGSFRIRDERPSSANNRYLQDVVSQWYFAPGRGMVRREIEPGPQAEENVPVVEELVEYRLME